jgi:membrane protease YdiL (CAAX protease family)
MDISSRPDAALPALWQAVAGVVLACVLWVAVFGLKLVNFWLGMSCATLLLAGLSVGWAGLPLERREMTVKRTGLAVLSAAGLYGLFALGRYAAVTVLPFAPGQIGSIYAIRQEAAPGVIALVLIFVTSPCEEVFWRGFLQRFTMARFGEVRGWLVAALAYAGVHVASGNVMLTGAALTAGLFWGCVYMRTRSLYVCIVSHALWTVAIFLIWPL